MRPVFALFGSRRSIRTGSWLAVVALVIGLFASPAAALTLNPGLVLSGVPNSNYPNAGGTIAGDSFPWLTLEISTIGSGGAVSITGTASLPSSWFITNIYLNVAGLESTLADAAWGGSGAVCSGCEFAAFSVSSNKWKSGPDGYYDSIIGFSTPNDSATSFNRFSGSDTFSLTLTCTGSAGCANFTEESFNVLSAASGSTTAGSSASGFRIAAHIQGLPASGTCAQSGALTEGSCTSTWIAGAGPNGGTTTTTTTTTQETPPSNPQAVAAVPEPSVMTLVAIGLVGLSFFGTRRLQAARAKV